MPEKFGLKIPKNIYKARFRCHKILPMEVIYKMARKVQFVETVLRDANQSLIATRLPYEKFEPMLESID